MSRTQSNATDLSSSQATSTKGPALEVRTFCSTISRILRTVGRHPSVQPLLYSVQRCLIEAICLAGKSLDNGLVSRDRTCSALPADLAGDTVPGRLRKPGMLDFSSLHHLKLAMDSQWSSGWYPESGIRLCCNFFVKPLLHWVLS